VNAGDSAKPVTLSVLTTCLNEADNIDQLVKRMLRTIDRMDIVAELVVVDDGSQDGTWDGVTSWVKRDARVRGVRHERNRGIESGWRSALAESRGSLVCLIDADLQNRPEDVALLYDEYRAGRPLAGRRPDVVQGVRRPANLSRIRYLQSRGLNTILNAAFRMQLADNKSGFILCRREVLDRLLTHRFNYHYYQCFLTAAAHARGYTIGQVDTVFEPRMGGESFLNTIPVAPIARILWEIVKAWVDLYERDIISTSRARASL